MLAANIEMLVSSSLSFFWVSHTFFALLFLGQKISVNFGFRVCLVNFDENVKSENLEFNHPGKHREFVAFFFRQTGLLVLGLSS